MSPLAQDTSSHLPYPIPFSVLMCPLQQNDLHCSGSTSKVTREKPVADPVAVQ